MAQASAEKLEHTGPVEEERVALAPLSNLLAMMPPLPLPKVKVKEQRHHLKLPGGGHKCNRYPILQILLKCFVQFCYDQNAREGGKYPVCSLSGRPWARAISPNHKMVKTFFLSPFRMGLTNQG